ncbi:hypothetical protein C343_04702 [Cryptococcus neoformans C23]|uniref:Uncharacterized protein n=2 Tax=Cryptococcus neoformans TaxID=5207 RepID=A0A854QCY3_CRYNE|nr:hypothetical protein CNAG_03355 [Cryptococcus neoformans var. grubii H99]AUB26511.1 hypothetical protein CKF44_03355 [Cryptococcus neoformans var. grubii]OWZ29669.1 hypothetical protein C347_04750 [Cryptococcus neoformans var. grubii AD2-60a]OWZ41541.1 hypothetical protein C343_04702 [Cryptococcus neoformans var. grubii C23]OWZ52547.1 hypothetical protein C368_04776 [Cryptococcus neoformans var. grubii 125.91]OXC83283.1 hypothetical protein C344_04428 [Cryptococcus neoformans var. grubii AD|eukprot:XP_012050924.1 hypothetical protein CNAG_03355 [Cryptococcus neoformans var. grubii H99]
MLGNGSIDYSALPTRYLESYPYPSLVLLVPIPPPSQPSQEELDEFPSPSFNTEAPKLFTCADHGTSQPFDIVWANEKWRNLTNDQPLLNCLNVKGARKLGNWIGGVKEATGNGKEQIVHVAKAAGVGIPEVLAKMISSQSSSEFSVTQMLHSADPGQDRMPQPPEHFWAPEHPYEDRSTKSDHLSNSSELTGIEVEEGMQNNPATVIIELVNPGTVTLEFTKTIMPVTRLGTGGLKAPMNTHSFAIITTVPKSLFVPNSSFQSSPLASPELQGVQDEAATRSNYPLAIPKTTILSPSQSPPPLPFSTAPQSSLTPNPDTDNISPAKKSLIDELKGPGILPPSKKHSAPLMFNGDGTVSRQAQGLEARGESRTSVDVLMDQTDWSKTPLGPLEQWSQSLKTIVGLVLNYPHQCCLWWGEELTLIYNEPYARAIHKHPDIFGMSGPVAWSEIWNSIGPLSEVVLSGTPVWKEDDFLLFKQLPHQGEGVWEEYHTWMWVPVLQEDGTFGGLWNATVRTTKKVLAERRTATVREMGQRTSIARTMDEFNDAVCEILESNPRDTPFAALYRVEPTLSSKGKGLVANTAEITKNDPNEVQVDVTLVGRVGIPESHPSTPSSMSFTIRQRRGSSINRFPQGLNSSPAMSLISSTGGISHIPLGDIDEGESEPYPTPELKHWPIREALQCKRLILVENVAGLIKDYPIRVWDELPNAAIVVPIRSDSEEGIPSAVLVLGLNIRRPFDEDYESFIHVLRLQLASGIAAVRSYEAERLRLDELAALDRAKSLLFSNVSHELRTPLTLISGPIEDLLMETKDGPKKEMLLMARRNLRRLSRLVSTLMDVSRLEAGRLRGTFRPVNLGIMTRDLALLFKATIEKAKLKYIIEVDTSPENVFVDPEHWEKIVFNLIGNAMKYTMTGFVKIELYYSSGQAILTVQDSGVGIPRSDIHLIGERFHRVQSVSRSHEGTGIGLSLTKELISLHGGTLEIESFTEEESIDGSHGSTFRVKIPIGSDHLPFEAIDTGRMPNMPQLTYGQGLVDEAMQWVRDRETGSVVSSDESSSALTGDSSGMGNAKPIDPNTLYFQKEDVIMLVEDSADTRRYMKSIFSQYCQVVEARDGQEALELCQKSVPDLIISDVMMPHLNGFELLVALKRSKDLKMVPVIMLTARGADESKVDGIMAGAEDYLAKPFSAREIVARAHMQLQLGKKRRHLEEAFEERTAELRALAEFSPVGIFRADQNGNITFANSAWYKVSGYPMNEPIVDWVDVIIAPHEREAARAFWKEALTSPEKSLMGDWEYANGRWITVTIIRLDAISNGSVGLKGLLGCVTDITERKVHEESQRRQVIEAEQRRLDAEEAKRQQELLIDITSHEIRNPISSVMQCSSLVKTNLLSLQEQLHIAMANHTAFIPTRQLMNNIEEDLEALESIYQCGLTQERISNDVLSLGRIQLDMLQMFDVEFDLSKEAQNIISIFQNEARMKRISLSLKTGDNNKKLGIRYVKADLVRLNQITTNLLSNAIRFTATSSIRHIEVRTDISFDPPEEGTCAVAKDVLSQPPVLKDDMPIFVFLEVADTGPGLSEDECQKLFQRFSQVSPKTHTIFGGSGLGLFVCRKLAELMGGSIEVVSEKGKGSTFRFYIKAKTCRTSPATDSDLRAKMKAQRDTARYFGLRRRPHVLIVEDNLINQTVLARQLKHCNLTCDVANDGLEALEKIRKVSSIENESDGQAFDCVLMDLEMPVMDGLTAVGHIREEENAGKLKKNLVIALTGNARQGQIDLAKASGMDEVVIKPYRLDDLLHKIEEVIKIRVAEEDEEINQEVEVETKAVEQARKIATPMESATDKS